MGLVENLVTKSLVSQIDRSDADFEYEFFPAQYRGFVSRCHWTPIAVARRAASWLTTDENSRVLDVGSGIGKFCIVGSLQTGCEFVGIDNNLELVQVSREAAEQARAKRAYFEHRNVLDFDFADFTGVYLFNPFYELIDGTLVQMGAQPALSPRLHRHYVSSTAAKLSTMPGGTRVVTYNGFGGTMPSTYACVIQESCPAPLQFWVKEDRPSKSRNGCTSGSRTESPGPVCA